MAASSSSMIRSVSLVMTLALFLSFAAAMDILVGGKPDAWKVPSDADSLNKWAQKSRFQIGDNLVWKYDSKKDSVLEVTREAYLSCNTTSPIEAHADGETKVKIEKSGPHYFISGSQPNCEKGEKLTVVVMAPRRKPVSPAPVSPSISPESVSPSISPAMAPATFEDEAPGPAVAPAPTSGASGVKAGFMLGLGVMVSVIVM